MDVLNKEKKYTVCYRKIIERTAYSTKSMEEGMQDFEVHHVNPLSRKRILYDNKIYSICNPAPSDRLALFSYLRERS